MRGMVTDSLVQLVSSLPRLQELVLQECQRITDKVLCAIAEHHPQLTALSLCLSKGFRQIGAHALVKRLHALRRFASDGIVFNDLVIAMWKERLPWLQSCSLRLSTEHFQDIFG